MMRKHWDCDDIPDNLIVEVPLLNGEIRTDRSDLTFETAIRPSRRGGVSKYLSYSNGTKRPASLSLP